MQVTCSCGKVLNVPDKLAGKSARCPACKKILQMPAAPSGAPLPTRIMVTCSCGKKLAAPPSAAGKKVLCPKCSKELTVPGAVKAPSGPAFAPMSPAASFAAAPAAPRKPGPASTSNLSFEVEAPAETPKPEPAPVEPDDGDAEKSEYGLGNRKCPNCKADLPHSAQFCVECGTALATGTKIRSAATATMKKKGIHLEPDQIKKIIYGAILLVLVGLVYWWLYAPHGMTADEMKRAVQKTGGSGPPRVAPVGGE